jgi:hypothetical protein
LSEPGAEQLSVLDMFVFQTGILEKGTIRNVDSVPEILGNLANTARRVDISASRIPLSNTPSGYKSSGFLKIDAIGAIVIRPILLRASQKTHAKRRPTSGL